MTIPLAMAPWISIQFRKIDPDTGLDVPNAGGFIWTYVAGSTTPQATYTNAVPTLVAHSNPIELDDEGRPPSNQIFLLPAGYTIEEQDSTTATIRTYDFVEDVGSTFMVDLGTIQATGTTATGSGPYTVLATDNLVIVDSATANYVVQLPPAADRTFPLTIKNISAIAVRVTPDSAEEIEGAATYYVLPAVSGAINATVTLVSDGTSAWWATGGIGL